MRKKHTYYTILFFAIILWCNQAMGEKPLNVKTHINWSKTKCQINKAHWAINDYETATPALIADTDLWKYTQVLNPDIVRIHHALLSDSLTTPETQTWDKKRIATIFELAQKAFPNARFLVNPICVWPKFMNVEGEVLNSEQESEIIRLFADFALIVKELKLPIYAIEIFNEREQAYDKEGKLPQLWNLYNRISTEIAKQNNEIKIAGPALTWPKPQWVESFLDTCGKQTDIFTWHGYASGNPQTPNKEIISNGVDKFASFAQYTNKEITKRGLTKLKNYMTEYNIQWVWEPYETRHGSNVGAVFQALTISCLAKQHLDGLMVWHLKGHSYGLIENNDEIRSTGYLYLWGNKYLCGKMVKTTTSDTRLETVAVENTEGKRSLLLINKSDNHLNFKLNNKDIGFEPAYSAQINDSGFKPQDIIINNYEIDLEPWSVTLLTSNKN